MFCTYIIQSTKKNWFYVGITENIEKRLEQHNKGYGRTTQSYRPFKLVYTNYFSTRTEARDHEKYLKIRSNKEEVLRGLGLF